jgi:hypothetical protein
MVLEIINSCLSHQLAHNPNLIYTLLYKKHVFEPFRAHPAFQDIVQNIDAVSLTTYTKVSKLLYFFIKCQSGGVLASDLKVWY